MGSAADIPAALIDLCHATTDAEADKAYWRIDNVVVVQGRLFEAAAATATCILTCLPGTVGIARTRLLELLVQLGNGEPDPSELALGNVTLSDVVRRELTRAFSFYAYLIQSGLHDSNETECLIHCIDLLLVCSLYERSLKDRVVWYYEMLLENGIEQDEVRQLISNCLIEVRK
ncbi:MAG: hypothetical protein M3N13_00230 [Candidatus Eremiobacteraeota bacterium]|nr:hypothetical protein [Candidatus Eremiobacteraeota bacterium]